MIDVTTTMLKTIEQVAQTNATMMQNQNALAENNTKTLQNQTTIVQKMENDETKRETKSSTTTK